VAALHCGATIPEPARRPSDRTMTLLARAPAFYAPPGSAITGGETEAMRATFEAVLEPQARVRVHYEPALDLVAASIAETFSDTGQHPSHPLVQWLFWRSGSPALYESLMGGWAGDRRRGRLTLEHWARQAAERLNARPGSDLSYGVARFTEGSRTSECVVLGWAPFDVPAFAKTYAPGGPLTLALRPRSPLREILVSIDEGSAVREQTLAPDANGAFFFSSAAPTRPGRHFVEVQGPGPERATLMLVPIYVGAPEPATPDDFIQSPPPGPADLAGWPAWLASTYDAERAKLGKGPVEIDARLDALAVERSAAYAAGRPPAPTGTESFSAQIAAMGFRPDGFSEDVLAARGTDAVLLRLLRPSARKRLLLSERLLLGASAAPRPRKENHPERFMLVEETVLGSAR